MVSRKQSKLYIVTIIGMVTNLLLVIFKVSIGLVGYSQSLVADGFHSLSDLGSDIAVLIGIKFGLKPPDESHKYGHGKIETLVALFIGLLLLFVSWQILVSAISSLLEFFQGQIKPPPTTMALLTALLSIAAKELLYQHTFRVGKKLNSPSVIANAWHHRTDAFSSIAVAAGIGASIVLGGSWLFLDPLVAVVLSFFIAHSGLKIVIENLKELTDTSLGDKIENEIKTIVAEDMAIESMHDLRTRKIGAIYDISFHICVSKERSFVAAHQVADNLEDILRKRFGQETAVLIHVDPC